MDRGQAQVAQRSTIRFRQGLDGHIGIVTARQPSRGLEHCARTSTSRRGVIAAQRSAAPQVECHLRRARLRDSGRTHRARVERRGQPERIEESNLEATQPGRMRRICNDLGDGPIDELEYVAVRRRAGDERLGQFTDVRDVGEPLEITTDDPVITDGVETIEAPDLAAPRRERGLAAATDWDAAGEPSTATSRPASDRVDPPTLPGEEHQHQIGLADRAGAQHDSRGAKRWTAHKTTPSSHVAMTK